MSELSLAALKPNSAPAQASPRPGSAATELGGAERARAARPQAEGSRAANTADNARGRGTPADHAERRSLQSTGNQGNNSENGVEREASLQAAASGGENSPARAGEDSATPFASVLAAQLEPRPGETGELVLAAVPAAIETALARAPAAPLVAGGNGLPPVALEKAIARHGETLAKTIVRHGETLAKPAANPGAATGEIPLAATVVKPQPEALPSTLAATAEEAAVEVGRHKSAAPPAAAAVDERSAQPFENRLAAARDGVALATTSVNGDATDGLHGARLSAFVDAPLGHARWSQAFSERVNWLVREGGQLASLRLDPPQLGPVDVRISVNNGETSLSFVSAHASVREAIEAALPRLREMLGEQGLALGNVDVSGRESRDDGDDGRARVARADGGAGDDGMADDEGAQAPLPATRVRLGLLDHYA